MKKISILLALFTIQFNLLAQDFLVKGSIVNQNKQPVEFVNVIVFKNNSLQPQGTITDNQGLFELKLKSGIYKIVLAQFGEEHYSTQIDVKKDINLGEIEIKESQTLDNVIVTARKKLVKRKVDRLVFDVENSASATGGTAIDALKSTPLVIVQNENVSIVGRGEVLLMIDDRIQKINAEDLGSFLNSIASDNIKSIEVITTPPAKYEAEGNAGLINIKLKKAKANSWNANIGSTYLQRTYASNSINGAFNYNRNKLSTNVFFSVGNYKLKTNSEQNIFYSDELWKTESNKTTETISKSLGAGLDYKLSNSWTTGFKYLGSFTDRASKNIPFTVREDYANTVQSHIKSTVEDKNKPEMNSFNWYNTFKLDTIGSTITTDLDYFTYNKYDESFFAGDELDNIQNVIPDSFFSSTNKNKNNVENWSGKIDVELPTKWASLSFGGKVSFTNTNNDLSVFNNETGTPVLDVNQSNIFKYKENNQALYVSFSKQLSQKWETQIGLRMEATQTKGFSQNLNQTNTNNYTQLFPTVYFTYNANDKSTYSLSFSRRIRRPTFNYLNPFITRTSPFYFSEGNPFLQPTYINDIDFSYMYNQNWNFSAYYSRVTDFAQRLSILDSITNITQNIPLNYANQNFYGLSIDYTFSKWNWWTSYTGINVNYQNIESKINAVEAIDGFNTYIYSNNNFSLNSNRTILLDVNYGLQPTGRNQIFHITTSQILDISAKFLFMDKDLALTITGNDLLNGNRSLFTYTSNNVKTTTRSYNDTQALRISLTYKFGNKNLRTKRKSFGNDDERNRVD